MGTAATATRVRGPATPQSNFEGIFTVLLDTTDANGLMTVDLTDYFSYIHSVEIGGALASTGYFVDVQVPGPTVALTSTNLVLGFYEAGEDGGPLDAVALTSFATAITGLTLIVKGRQAV